MSKKHTEKEESGRKEREKEEREKGERREEERRERERGRRRRKSLLIVCAHVYMCPCVCKCVFDCVLRGGEGQRIRDAGHKAAFLKL